MLNDSSIRSEPFLWIHLSGIVFLPVLLEIVWVSLALGNSFSPILELSLLGIGGIVPVLLMQLIRPFNIFSILLVSLKAESLTSEQKKILSLFKTTKQNFFSLLAAFIMAITLGLLYRLSPLSIGIASCLPQWHLLGLAIAILAFLGSNLFLQVPLGVLLVLLTKQSRLSEIEPYTTEKIDQNFTTPGIKVSRFSPKKVST